MKTEKEIPATKTPFEELKQNAIEHYQEVASKVGHWNGFISRAIQAYQQPSPAPDSKTLEEQTIVTLERILLAIQRETRAIDNHPDPGALIDCWNTVRDLIAELYSLSRNKEEWHNPYLEMFGLLTNIRHEIDYLPDSYYEWIDKVLNKADEIAENISPTPPKSA